MLIFLNESNCGARVPLRAQLLSVSILFYSILQRQNIVRRRQNLLFINSILLSSNIWNSGVITPPLQRSCFEEIPGVNPHILHLAELQSESFSVGTAGRYVKLVDNNNNNSGRSVDATMCPHSLVKRCGTSRLVTGRWHTSGFAPVTGLEPSSLWQVVRTLLLHHVKVIWQVYWCDFMLNVLLEARILNLFSAADSRFERTIKQTENQTADLLSELGRRRRLLTSFFLIFVLISLFCFTPWLVHQLCRQHITLEILLVTVDAARLERLRTPVRLWKREKLQILKDWKMTKSARREDFHQTVLP